MELDGKSADTGAEEGRKGGRKRDERQRTGALWERCIEGGWAFIECA